MYLPSHSEKFFTRSVLFVEIGDKGYALLYSSDHFTDHLGKNQRGIDSAHASNVVVNFLSVSDHKTWRATLGKN